MLKKPHERDFLFLKSFPGLTGPIIDVGGNGGQSIVSFAIFCRHAHILSVEPNPGLHSELEYFGRRFVKGRFRLIPYALGDRDGTAILRIPLHGSLPIDARASILTGARDFSGMQKVEVKMRRFDDLTAEELGIFRDPEVVKIDVEGYEGPVIRGMSAMLRRAQPLVIFERSSSFPEVAAELAGLDYVLYGYDPKVHRLTKFDPDEDRLNIFALPQNWRRACEAKGLIPTS